MINKGSAVNMTRIGLLSDTHGSMDPKIRDWFKEVDEIWHAGDIGSMDVLDQLEAFKPLWAVFGNIDDHRIRVRTREDQIFSCESMKVWMTHIGGSPGKYQKRVLKGLEEIKPDILVCGHSHILKVIYDHRASLMYLNPGAAGKSGLHQVRTVLRFSIDGGNIKELEVLELPRRQ